MDCFHQPLVKVRIWVCPTSDNQDVRQNGHHLSIYAVVVTLTQSFLIGYLLNFIYELLSSSFHSSLNTGFVRRDNQDGGQNGHHLSISDVVVTLTQSFLIPFLPNFIYGLLLSTSRSSWNTGFVRHPITTMADKMAATYQYPLSWSL